MIRVSRSGICSTDLQMIRGVSRRCAGCQLLDPAATIAPFIFKAAHKACVSSLSPLPPLPPLPIVLTVLLLQYKDGFTGVMGHEFVGVVVSVHPDTPEKDAREWIGQRVVGEINVAAPCDSFYGLAPDAVLPDLRRNHCPNRTCLGIVGKDGAHAEKLTLPLVNLLRVPDAVSDEAAVFCEPLAAACRIVEQKVLLPTDRVAIIGDGKLGLLVGEVLGCQGLDTRPTLIGRHPHKLALVGEACRTVVAAPRAAEGGSGSGRCGSVPRAARPKVIDCKKVPVSST